MVEWSDDVSAADWWVERLHPFAAALGSFVPEGFDAYARVLHPAWRSEGGERVRARWAQLAAETGTPLTVTTCFEELEPRAAACIAQSPAVGSLDEEDLSFLVEVLAAHTESAESCWFGIWDGYAWMNGPSAVAVMTSHPPGRRSSDRPELPDLPQPPPPGHRVRVPSRSYALYRGPIEAALAFCPPLTAQSPNVWWPEDRAWFVATEIDFRSTYLGGSRALVARLVSDERLEALAADVADRVSD